MVRDDRAGVKDYCNSFGRLAILSQGEADSA